MEIIIDKKQVNRLIIVLMITYMASYITRINYGAIVSEMELATGMSRSLLSMALTGGFITYGAGQIISGILGDKFSPKKLVSCGFVITIIMNFMIPFCKHAYQMLVLWCINGFAQSLMWPPMVRIMSSLLSESDYKLASLKVSWGSSLGTIFIYFASPVLISIAGWKSVFIFSAVIGVIVLCVWNKLSYDAKKEPVLAVQEYTVKSGNVIFTPVMICVMIVIIFQGMLRDGVTTWMPTYISETYNLSSVISILTGVVLPAFGILSFQIASKLYTRIPNPIMCSGVIFSAGAVAAFGMYVFSGGSALVSVFLSALLTSCMHGVNLILICMLPAFFKKYGNVSTVSGIINSCTYIGSAASSYGVAFLSESYGWSFTLIIWLCIAVAGSVLCFVNTRSWYKKYQSDNSL